MHELSLEELIISFDSLLRLLAATVCGALIGWNRERLDKPAGLRTHMLVCLGSATFIVGGLDYMDSVPSNPPQWFEVDLFRIVAGIVGGIGFLGAGSIMQSRGEVSGLTTAASIWVSAAVGTACGMGFIGLALASIILAVATLSGVAALERRFFPQSEARRKDRE